MSRLAEAVAASRAADGEGETSLRWVYQDYGRAELVRLAIFKAGDYGIKGRRADLIEAIRILTVCDELEERI